jgi:holliday junction DNA helicase RuvA
MIAILNGKLIQVDSGSLVVDVNGVGFFVHVPTPLSDQVYPGENIFLFTHLVVRQDMLALYGFDTAEGREYFDLLLLVDGIGPRLALAILSTLTPETIRRAIFHEQAEVFSRVPGVGKKTAQKILLTLQDKIKPGVELAPIAVMSEVDSEVLNALIHLGYSVVEAQAAIQSIPRDAPQDVETHLRFALQYFS